MSTPARTQYAYDEQLRPLVDELLVDAAGGRRRDATPTPIERAVAFAAERHADQVRKSGEPYVVHPIGVAQHLRRAARRDAR